MVADRSMMTERRRSITWGVGMKIMQITYLDSTDCLCRSVTL